MEPIEAPPHAIWRDDLEEFGPDRWTEADPVWAAPELDLGDGRRLVLDWARSVSRGGMGGVLRSELRHVKRAHQSG
jgi:hypothetical protein